jgi:hypothetical protein
MRSLKSEYLFMGYRIGKRFVPQSTIEARMDRKDLRYQAAARREAQRRASVPVGALLAHGFHQTAADVTPPRPAAPRTEPRQFQTYWLPDGRYIEIDAELARGQFIVSFTLETGTVVNAVRMDAPKEGL